MSDMSKAFRVCFSVLCILSLSQVVNSQCLNFTLISQFTYKCGLGWCNILTEYCDDSGSLKQCSYCNRDVCNSDPQDYPGCKIACDYQFNKKPTIRSTIRSSTLSQTSKHMTTSVPKTDNTEIKCNSISDREYRAIYYSLLGFLIPSVLFNVICFIVCIRKCKQRNGFAQKKKDTINSLMMEKEVSDKTSKEETNRIDIDIQDPTNDRESENHPTIPPKRVQDLRNHRRYPSNTSVKTVESGYDSPINTPEINRRLDRETEGNEMLPRNESKGGNIVTNPQGEVSYKTMDGVVSPTGR